MQVAVAGMEDVDAAQTVGLLHGADGGQHVAETLAGDRAVHAVVIGRDASSRGEGRLAPRPEPDAFDLVSRDADPRGTAAFEHGPHAGDLLRHFLGRAVRFAEQDGDGIEVVTRVDEGLHRRGDALVHHLQAGRDGARGDHGRHRFARLPHIVEAGHDALGRLRLGGEPDGHFRDDAEEPLGADEQGQQVVAGRVQGVAPELQDVALDGHDPDAEHVVHGEAILEAVHTTGVLRHVPADGAGDLGTRVGRVVQAMGQGRLGDRQIPHPCLHHSHPSHGVEVEDAVELRQAQQHPLGVGHGAGRKARPRAPRHDGDARPVTGSQDGHHLRFVFGQGHGQGQPAVGGQAVAFVGPQQFLVGDERTGRQDGTQFRQQGFRSRLWKVRVPVGGVFAHLHSRLPVLMRPGGVSHGPLPRCNWLAKQDSAGNTGMGPLEGSECPWILLS